MAKKKSSKGVRGHRFTAKESANGLLQSRIQEHMDAQLLIARDALHQYVTMIAAEAATVGVITLPADFEEKNNEIVGKLVAIVRTEVASYLETLQR